MAVQFSALALLRPAVTAAGQPARPLPPAARSSARRPAWRCAGGPRTHTGRRPGARGGRGRWAGPAVGRRGGGAAGVRGWGVRCRWVPSAAQRAPPAAAGQPGRAYLVGLRKGDAVGLEVLQAQRRAGKTAKGGGGRGACARHPTCGGPHARLCPRHREPAPAPRRTARTCQVATSAAPNQPPSSAFTASTSCASGSCSRVPMVETDTSACTGVGGDGGGWVC